jgi:hypothetical protein
MTREEIHKLPWKAQEYINKLERKLTLTHYVKIDSEQLKDKQKLSFDDWLRNLSQEELAWYEGKYVEVFLSL